MKILIVDDSLSWRDFHKNTLEEIFSDCGMNVETEFASSGAEGLRLAEENLNAPFDLIISDLQMEEDFYPKYAGEWFIERIKEINAYKNTKIIISSGCSDIKHIAQRLSVDCIPKRTAVTDIDFYKSKLSSRI